MSVRSWQERLYPDPATRDPVVFFLRALEQIVRPEQEVLDIGAGAGQLNRYQLKGRVRRIVGIDLDPRVRDNPLLDEGIVASADSLPFPDSSFDLAFSIYVLEHIRDAAGFAREIARVLRPGGYFLGLTPNRYHYVPLLAGLTPTSFHQWFNKRRGRAEDDTFPTWYRLNTRRALRRHFEASGLQLERFSMIEVQPNYLKFSTPSFLLGAAYERLVNSTDWLAGLRVNIIALFRKGKAPYSVQP
jgi:SAM-dependent methyltransferase